MKLETRSIGLFPDKTGFGLGSSEARCSIQYFSSADQSKNFSFKCHRDKDQRGFAYQVNSVVFHPKYGTFATAGGDGIWHFWDKEARHRLKSGPKKSMPITTSRFSPDGSLYIYATGYDWSKGVDEYEKNVKNSPAKAPKIFIHVVKEQDVLPKSR